MSRQYNSQSDPVEYHRRSNQPYETSNYASRGSPRNYPLARTSPLHDNGSDKGEQQPRRRIGLACSRCRKRKIKCSGDNGGAGCQNCKNAGVEECNFLRVNSTSLLAASTALEYPYSNASSTSLPVSMGRSNSGMGSLYSGGFGMMQAPAAVSYPARNGPINGQHYSLTSRHSHPSVANSYNLAHMNDDAFDHYSPAPQYLLPAQDPSMSTYGAQDTSRHWTPIAGNRQSNSVGYESDPSLRYGASGFPYLNSSAVASIPENFGMNSLSLSREVPRHGDRILPTPRKMSYEPSSNSYPKPDPDARDQSRISKLDFPQCFQRVAGQRFLLAADRVRPRCNNIWVRAGVQQSAPPPRVNSSGGPEQPRGNATSSQKSAHPTTSFLIESLQLQHGGESGKIRLDDGARIFGTYACERGTICSYPRETDQP
ncbi:MAG: hypothetical protein Q9216_005367 [Gyalolechia sp. 2 TL-2023]